MQISIKNVIYFEVKENKKCVFVIIRKGNFVNVFVCKFYLFEFE